MRKIIQILLLGFALSSPSARAASEIRTDYERAYADLLAGHVREGWVDYRGLAGRRAQLDACLEGFERVTMWEFNGWTVPQRLAFLANFYNATVLKIAVADYPLKRFRQAGGWFGGDPFQWKSLRLLGHKTSLSILFRNYIRRDYAEPMMVLALCPAERSSPPLRAEPYFGDRLDEQLDDQARVFLSRSPYNRIDKERRRVHLSPVFKIYEADFARKYGSLRGFLDAKAPREWGSIAGYSISFTATDSRLNDLAKASK